MNTVSHKYRQSALLLLTAAIWGSAFVAQKTGMDYVGPFTFNAARKDVYKRQVSDRPFWAYGYQ